MLVKFPGKRDSEKVLNERVVSKSQSESFIKHRTFVVSLIFKSFHMILVLYNKYYIQHAMLKT
jgi:hypothetical protein